MPRKKLRNNIPATYRIRVQGTLTKSWSDRLGGVTIYTADQANKAPVTVLSGQLQDQAVLLGVLNTLHDLRLPLLSVECESWEEDNLDKEVKAEL